MKEEFPYSKSINMLKLEIQVQKLFNSSLIQHSQHQYSGTYHGKVNGIKFSISCSQDKPFKLKTRTEKEWTLVSSKILDYLIKHPLPEIY